MARLGREFYDRDTIQVARDLLGTDLVRVWRGATLVGRITETEAYVGPIDKACHAFGNRRTPRTETPLAPPGTAYLYLIYGMYHCLNLVTVAQGAPCFCGIPRRMWGWSPSRGTSFRQTSVPAPALASTTPRRPWIFHGGSSFAASEKRKCFL